jgi:hypothetical protein
MPRKTFNRTDNALFEFYTKTGITQHIQHVTGKVKAEISNKKRNLNPFTRFALKFAGQWTGGKEDATPSNFV